VVQVSRVVIENKAADNKESFDAMFAKIMAGAERVFAPAGGGDVPKDDFSYSAVLTDDQFAVRRWRGGPIALAVGSAGADAGAAQYAARRWRAAIDEGGGAMFSVRRFRAGSDAMDAGIPDYSARRWRSMPEPGATGAFDTRRFRSAEEEKAAVEFTEFAARRWRVNPKADADATMEVEEFIARRWRAIRDVESGDAIGTGIIPEMPDEN
jgi:hypothetical protein